MQREYAYAPVGKRVHVEYYLKNLLPALTPGQTLALANYVLRKGDGVAALAAEHEV